MKKAFEKRGIATEPLLSHSYERVMPGREYVASIRDFWRVCSGINDTARERVAKFLTEILNVEKFPLTVLDRPIESETCKIVENSYRATILAFLNEWSLFAERNGVDLIKVIQAIKVRPTHSNMIFPGPGIGGYCLPKDGGLGVWSYQTLMGFDDDIFKITPLAIDINDTRSLHAAELVRDALRNMGKIVAASKIVVLGASYREDVGDTRYSGSEALVRKLTEMGAEIGVHDPYVKHWWELEKQETYPAPGHSWARFFRNQEKLTETPDRARPEDGPEGRRCGGPGRPPRGLPEARSRRGHQDDRPPRRRHRLLRHPRRRADPPLLRTRLRGEGPRPRPRQEDKRPGLTPGETLNAGSDSQDFHCQWPTKLCKGFIWSVLPDSWAATAGGMEKVREIARETAMTSRAATVPPR